MKKVVITGAGGFLGGHLVNYFISHGSDVIAVFHREPEENIEQITKRQTQKNELQARILPEHQAHLAFFDGDITNQRNMNTLFEETEPDTLIHAAALLVPPKESDYLNSTQYQQANARFIEINQGQALADCVAHYQQQHDLYCLLVSTIYIFNLKSPRIDETTEHTPLNLYATCKHEAQQYWESKVTNLAVIYPPQIYGPHQFTPALMPKLIRKMLFDESNQLTLRGAMNPVHVNNLSPYARDSLTSHIF
jgi:nucleoside-diphosphate-sugar epimerase